LCIEFLQEWRFGGGGEESCLKLSAETLRSGVGAQPYVLREGAMKRVVKGELKRARTRRNLEGGENGGPS